MRRSRLHITGASGSGKTSLARSLAAHWSAPLADTDDYFFRPSNPPFVVRRAEEERVRLMREVFVPREAWVLFGSMIGWGDGIVAECDAVVFLTLDPDERLRRLEDRETRRRAGDDVDEASWTEFMTWASGYDDPDFDGQSLASHEAWLARLATPVLRLDSSRPLDELTAAVLEWEPSRDLA